MSNSINLEEFEDAPQGYQLSWNKSTQSLVIEGWHNYLEPLGKFEVLMEEILKTFAVPIPIIKRVYGQDVFIVRRKTRRKKKKKKYTSKEDSVWNRKSYVSKDLKERTKTYKKSRIAINRKIRDTKIKNFKEKRKTEREIKREEKMKALEPVILGVEEIKIDINTGEIVPLGQGK